MEFYIGLVIAITGLGLLARGTLRRRTGDQPYCRKCRFELSGIPDLHTCPECGRSLLDPRAVVRGRRPISRTKLVWGIACSVIGGALLSVDHANRTGFVNVTGMKPAWLLYAEAYALDGLRASLATDELVARGETGGLRANWEDRLINIALNRHAQTWRSFPDAQWVVIANALADGSVGDERIKQFYADCYEGLSIIEHGYSNPMIRSYDGPDEIPALYPGERLDVHLNTVWRAGSHERYSNLRLSPMAYEYSGRFISDDGATILEFERQVNLYWQGMTRNLSSDTRLFTPAFLLPINARPRILLPHDLGSGVYKGRLHLKYTFVPDGQFLNRAVAGGASKNQSYSVHAEIPYSFRVADPGELDPIPVLAEEISNPEQQDLVRFRVKWFHKTNRGETLVRFTVRDGDALGPGTGIAGRIYFEQYGGLLQSKKVCANGHINFHYDESQSHQGDMSVVLEGFEPGPMKVYYDVDPAGARYCRESMKRVLVGPVELGEIEVPEFNGEERYK